MLSMSRLKGSIALSGYSQKQAKRRQAKQRKER